jgi:type IV pilus assembly protein PilA
MVGSDGIRAARCARFDEQRGTAVLKSVAARRGRGDEGFTLVELMVVVLVLAILMAIAIPTFLGARDRGQDRAAQSTARNTLTAAKILYGDTGNYATLTATGASALRAVEPQYTYVVSPAASANEETVSVYVAGTGAAAQTVGIAVRSDSGTCYFIRDVQDNATVANIGTFYGSATTGACTGQRAATASLTPNTSW